MVVTTRSAASALFQEPKALTRQRRKHSKEKQQRRRNVFPVLWYESMCLVVSSCFFLFPGWYAFTENLSLYGVVSVITTIVSANYWRHAVEGLRRNVDLIVAKMSFLIYCLSGFWYARDWRLYAVGVPGIVGIGGCYYLSNYYWEHDSPFWVHFQMLFHTFVALEQALVIYAIVW